jgi:transcriptional regulator with XRE-family HTH domain
MEKSTHTREYAVLRSELRVARENAGLSQRDLAVRLKVPHSWVAKVESGERRIDVIELGWFIAACDADAFQLCEKLLRRTWQRQSGRGTTTRRLK